MRTREDLAELLRRIDGRGYKSYGDIRGATAFPDMTLYVDRVQPDPFASPSLMRVRVPMELARLPEDLFSTRVRRVALCDYLARAVRDSLGNRADPTDGRGSGRIQIDAGGQHVVERSAVVIDERWVEVRIEVGLPAAGRRVRGREAELLLVQTLPQRVASALQWENIRPDSAQLFVNCIDNQEHVRAHLSELGLIAFVGNGAVLPRESGASQGPMRGDEVVPFQSPPSLEVEIAVPHAVDASGSRSLRGMGVPKGVGLIVGGGYHGKSTLLQALAHCVYAHVPDDGREHVISVRDLVKIRAEDGRAVTDVDIHAFIGTLPSAGRRERSTRCFRTDDASGSTSQAASILEAVESGATGLLLDEDTSATNFMVRDDRMRALIRPEHEPITPFVDRVRELYDATGVSTVLVMGGCGDYFDVADRVVRMHAYRPEEVTREARAIAREHPLATSREPIASMQRPVARAPLAESFDPSHGRKEIRITAKGRDLLLYGASEIDLRAVEQLLEPSQVRALGLAILLAAERFMGESTPLRAVLDQLDALLDEQGLDILDPFGRDEAHPGALARPRRHEIAAALNRLRGLRVRQLS